MLLNPTQNGAVGTLMKLPSTAVCRHYLRYKVVFCKAKRRRLALRKPALNWLAVLALASLAAAGLLLCSTASQAAEKEAPHKQAAMPIELIELLGELGDDEADLDAAMLSVSNKQATKPSSKEPNSNKLVQPKPMTTENSNTGAKK